MTGLADVWPLFGLTLGTPRLTLRPLRDDDLPALADAARSGIHAPERTPFASPWTDAPPAELPANSARWIWECRARTRPESWLVQFGVFAHDGALLGLQDVGAQDFAHLATVETGSWLRRDAQGRGLGSEMRAAALAWAFDWLGAEVALTAAYDWNEPSLGVSRKLGYVPNGERRRVSRPGVVERELLLRLPKEAFRRPGWTLSVEGHGAAAAFLGVGA
ncbi:GNAT family N-acetyltransferase [Sinomonas atrocyanea]|uniref:GNAT family N-acetyltransferase n=1 Tax=Sinomonas atrocyanea TaxID=37927 RepID=UPI003D98C619